MNFTSEPICGICGLYQSAHLGRNLCFREIAPSLLQLENAALKQENEEQARLLRISESRRVKLLGERAGLQNENARYKAALEKIAKVDILDITFPGERYGLLEFIQSFAKHALSEAKPQEAK